ncbi:hypothetical protein [Luteibacter sp.]|uniref:hypothetical protein n=1 Tax=Luteibacter sp. TaxID=1886636 RepID=UPI003F80DC2B
MRRFARTTFVLATAAALASCAADVRNDSLTRTLNQYASAIRWGDINAARGMVDKDYLADHPMSSLEQSRLAQLRVTGYDEGAGPRPDGDNEVVQTVQISVVNVNTQAERSFVDQQRWHYDKEKNRWTLMTGLPDFSPH